MHQHHRHEPASHSFQVAWRSISAPPDCMGKLYSVRLFGLVVSAAASHASSRCGAPALPSPPCRLAIARNEDRFACAFR